MAPVWAPASAVHAIDAELLREHGGLSGSAKKAALESTLARPQQLLTYATPSPIISLLAAAHKSGLARNHRLLNGNKRIALAIMDVFMHLNGFELSAREEDAVLTIRSLAAGDLSEMELSIWIQQTSC